MEKDQAIRLIVNLHAEMKDLTIRAGVSEEAYVSFLEAMDQEETDLTELHTWLTETRFGPYDVVLKIWERHSPKTWAMYDLMEVQHLAEQKLLRKNFKALRGAWRICPYVVKKKKERPADDQGAEESSGEVRVQSTPKRFNVDHR